MDHIENLRKDIGHPNIIKKHSASVRLWHWLNLLVITGSLLTVLLNSTLFDVNRNAHYIQEQLQSVAVSITNQQASHVAHGLEDKVWDIHSYFGIALTVLFLFRLSSSFFAIKEQRFLFILKKSIQYYRSLTKKSTQAVHEVAIKFLYLLFYIFLSIMVITGMLLTFKQDLSISQETSHNVKEFHGFSMYIILAFIVVHIIGVVLAEIGKNRGIVSHMIHGGK